MKILSIKQPWAWLIVHGYKDVENRSWRTSFRGEFMIHAGKSLDIMAYTKLRDKYPLPKISDFKRGCVVGIANLVDVVKESKSPWFSGPIGFVLENARPISPIPLQGRLGLYQVDDAMLPHYYELPKRSTYEGDRA